MENLIAPPELKLDVPDEGGTRSLEVRWIRPGLIPVEMIERLGPFVEEFERREDRYLVDPWLPELGVKIRGDVQLDLKAYRGSPGELRVKGLGLGELELWEKWTFPIGTESLPPPESTRWLAIRKVRRRRSFALEAGRTLERSVADAELAGCTVELTEATVWDEPWWTLGFEAVGPVESLELELREAAAFLLRDSGLPAGLLLHREDSMSYVRWLGSQLSGPQHEGRPGTG